MTKEMLRHYVITSIAATAYFVVLSMQVSSADPSLTDPRALLPPIFALVALTAVVWLAMLLVRNVMIAIGKVSMRYYVSYNSDAPPEWVERPARAFMNLLELPVLFYVACILMLITNTADHAQVRLAWMFVGARIAHTLIYLLFNHVPWRFTAYVVGSVTLAVMWVRLAYALL